MQNSVVFVKYRMAVHTANQMSNIIMFSNDRYKALMLIIVSMVLHCTWCVASLTVGVTLLSY